ncbi:RBBP9/YdeN family alpha/beta hydrolase [Cupriavidus consociatus]|uniref:RBBP9/YdeN family alpha/beta hydrolase n=1 Tax=Cupriavidus consociatus TaxID=2821357 RepID=UPI001AE56432|nr:MULTISPECIES: alpha/beta hydrolase [unclassified Cupriavidus]MBP0618617.1 serine hydrolase family protein [Cupriavidus sp. LEh25]MDK2655256.1 alpha/beta hydrolase [Cupriavidus sp. LEh21]
MTQVIGSSAGPLPAAHGARLEIPRHLQVLTLPGLHGSGPGHWQSRWEQRFPDWQRVEQHDWSRPSLPLWAERVSEGVMRAQRVASRGALLVAHSFGCLAALRQASLDPAGIAGALLVAPADPDKFGVASLLPTYRLPFPTILVASRNDPWMPQRTAFSWGTLWGSELVDAGNLAHINADSGLGDWADGLALLGTLVQRIADASEAGVTEVASTPWEAGLEVSPGAPYI